MSRSTMGNTSLVLSSTGWPHRAINRSGVMLFTAIHCRFSRWWPTQPETSITPNTPSPSTHSFPAIFAIFVICAFRLIYSTVCSIDHLVSLNSLSANHRSAALSWRTFPPASLPVSNRPSGQQVPNRWLLRVLRDDHQSAARRLALPRLLDLRQRHPLRLDAQFASRRACHHPLKCVNKSLPRRYPCRPQDRQGRAP